MTTRWACILAGGVGKRFWPLSRRTRPKHLIPVVGTQTLVRQTSERLARIVGWDHLMVVTNAEQAAAVRAEIPETPAAHVLAEPLGRNTAACVGLALRWLHIHGRDDDVVGFFPSDHVIVDAARFGVCLEAGWRLAKAGHVVAFGIAPASPETGYGYIHVGAGIEAGDEVRAYLVRSFHEKPDRALAEQWVASGGYYWNSGMFVARVETLWGELKRHLPATAETLQSLGRTMTDEELASHHEAYARLATVSIDQGVMEKIDRMAMVEASFDWDDVGSWEAASQYWPRREGDNRIRGERVALVDCEGCRVHAEGLLVALVGMRDVVVVETGGAVLICARSHAQDVKTLVERLENEHADEYL